MTPRIAIAGAGISGLATAYALEQRGFDVEIFEARDEIGGPIRTMRRDGYTVETGPHTLLVRHRVVADILDDLDLGDQVVEADETAATRYIVRNGRPRPLPTSPLEFATTPVLSPMGRLRLLAEPLIPGRTDEIDEPLANFVRRRLGAEALDYLVDPFVGGVWAGDPDVLSARHAFPSLVELEESAGSIAIGAIKRRLTGGHKEETVPRRLVAFRDGMQTLVDRFADRLTAPIHRTSPVRKLRRDKEDWRVIYQRGKARRGKSFDAVVSTVPTRSFAELEWENTRPPTDAVDELEAMPYAPCCVLTLGFERHRVGHPLDGFGCLVPRVEDFNILGSLFVSSMFPGRAPDGCVNLTVFVGGARQPALTERSDGEILERAHLDLRRLLDIEGDPVFDHLTRWQRAIPQYEVGHGALLDRLDELESGLPNVFFAGNYRDGIAVPDLLEASVEHARRIETAFAN